MALKKLISDGRIHPGRIEETVAKCRSEIEVVMRQAGEQAAYDAGVPGLHPELIKLLGRLKYRTSYGQNVLNHCVETSRLAGLLAAEIGANVAESKKGGLLHDIGKAVDHEVEGPHAAIGGDIAARYGVNADRLQRHRRPPPGGRAGVDRGDRGADRRRHQRVAARRARREPRQLREAARRPAADRAQLPRRRALLRHPGRPRDPDPGAPGGSSTTSPRAGWRATWSRRSRSSSSTPARSR